jgi:hypothetical protein
MDRELTPRARIAVPQPWFVLPAPTHTGTHEFSVPADLPLRHKSKLYAMDSSKPQNSPSYPRPHLVSVCPSAGRVVRV